MAVRRHNEIQLSLALKSSDAFRRTIRKARKLAILGHESSVHKASDLFVSTKDDGLQNVGEPRHYDGNLKCFIYLILFL